MPSPQRPTLRGQLLTIAFLSIVVVWFEVAFVVVTGLTFTTWRAPGRLATAADVARAREKAVVVTLIAAPLAVWLSQKRRPRP